MCAGGRPFDRTLFGVVGVAGLALTFLWFISLHEVTNYNLNLLWAWPTHLVAAALVGRTALSEQVWRTYWLGTVGATLVMLAGWPLWPQMLYDGLIPLVMLGLGCTGRLGMGVCRGCTP